VTDELPGATITFLFTDIEGSARLLKWRGDEFALVLAEHHRLFRTLFDEQGRPARCEDGRLAGRSERVWPCQLRRFAIAQRFRRRQPAGVSGDRVGRFLTTARSIPGVLQ
jgi:hypothetical protein